jgi:lipopolysaccharide export system protein LptA
MTGRRHRISRLTVKLILVWAFSIMLPIGVAYGQSQVQSQDKSGVVDAEQPIDISADNLEVQQDKNLAIFSGNVIAVQGQIKLRAVTLRVWYRQAGQAAPDGGSVGGTIIRIDAIDKVFVSSASETAQGDLGIYDVPEQRLTLTGAVVLTRGQNVLRGNKLVMNMATGQSRISGGRVHGRFVPPKRKK